MRTWLPPETHYWFALADLARARLQAARNNPDGGFTTLEKILWASGGVIAATLGIAFVMAQIEKAKQGFGTP